MAQDEMDFGFTNESINIDSYGGIAFLKRSQTSRTPCTWVWKGGKRRIRNYSVFIDIFSNKGGKRRVEKSENSLKKG